MIARAFALIGCAALWGCESVPQLDFAAHPDASPGDDGGQDASSDAPPSDAADACPDTGVFTACCSSTLPCAGSCNPTTCGKCLALSCLAGEFCCGVTGGRGECHTIGTACP